jgi:hypothetical protein
MMYEQAKLGSATHRKVQIRTFDVFPLCLDGAWARHYHRDSPYRDRCTLPPQTTTSTAAIKKLCVAYLWAEVEHWREA